MIHRIHSKKAVLYVMFGVMSISVWGYAHRTSQNIVLEYSVISVMIVCRSVCNAWLHCRSMWVGSKGGGGSGLRRK